MDRPVETDPPQQGTAALVAAAAKGDDASMDALIARHLDSLRAFVRLRTSKAVRDRESCSDLAQSVCREVLAGASDFEYRGEAPFQAWLFAKALSKIQDRARFHGRQRRSPEREVRMDTGYAPSYADLLTPSRIAVGREELARLEAAFDELPEPHREVLTLLRVAGLSYREIGEHLGKSEGSVRGLADRARRRLAWILSRNVPHESHE